MRRLLLSLLLLPLLAQAELAETDWLDLMPPEDQRALETMPEDQPRQPGNRRRFFQSGWPASARAEPAAGDVLQ